MNRLNSLCDEELREELCFNGFDNFPITKTTRNVLIKKLRNHTLTQRKLKRATNVKNNSSTSIWLRCVTKFSITLSFFVVFFAAAVYHFVYISMSQDLASMMNAEDVIYDLCLHDTAFSRGRLCIQTDDFDSTLVLIKLTATELQKRMELNKCKDPSTSSTMSAREVINNAMRKSSNYSLMAVMQDLHNMEYLIKMNPQWNIANCDSNGNSMSFDDVIERRETQSNCFAILKPRLPFMCSLYYKMCVFITIIGWIGIISAVVYGIYFIYRTTIDIIQSNKDMKNHLIANIITTVMEKAKYDPENPLVVVNHLRDKLTSSQNSNSKWAWYNAITYLENNESRIKFQIGNRNGEDCCLMKWVDN